MEGKPKAGLKGFIHGVRVDAHAVWLAVRDPRTPMPIRIFGALVAAYALSPIDLVPDFVPVLGLVDDLLILPIGIWLFTQLIPPRLWAEYKAVAEAETRRPVSRAGAVIIVAVWTALAILIFFIVANWQFY
ncbi:YkvA family protein [Rhizorhapis suberifaciens]|uniref:Uncharacterized membrane protein YkvA (DUF1232 family) n=1 Tax=Rhizorhapis suberifaciens TaxID=13656 RepID=A0A840HU59_9SPHN|nr:YkvA family protein [Rhizorhapis suberifaciens]MBB4641139.1 uncharacterized membrane protein YkvA (DUF1232 family) [Rhizorhapis suberifaciens]